MLTGPTAIAFIKGEAVDAAKVITKFADDNKALIIKGGYMDGNALSADQVEAIAKLDNRETTLAKLAGAMKGSMAKAAALQRSCNQGCTHRRSPAGQEGSRSLSRHKDAQLQHRVRRINHAQRTHNTERTCHHG